MKLFIVNVRDAEKVHHLMEDSPYWCDLEKLKKEGELLGEGIETVQAPDMGDCVRLKNPRSKDPLCYFVLARIFEPTPSDLAFGGASRLDAVTIFVHAEEDSTNDNWMNE